MEHTVEVIPLTLKIGWFLIAFAFTCLAFWVAYRIVNSHQQGWSFKAWVADLNTTPYRIVVSIWLSVAVVIALMVGLLLGAQGILKKGAMQESIVDSILLFLFGMMGIDAASFIAKRATYKPSPPNPPDVEDAQAGATVPSQQLVGLQAGRPLMSRNQEEFTPRPEFKPTKEE